MTTVQINRNIPSNYKLEWVEATTLELTKEGKRVVKIKGSSRDDAVGAMKDWLILNSLWI